MASVVATARRMARSRANAGVSLTAVLRLSWQASHRLLLLLTLVTAALAVLVPLTLVLVQHLVDAFTGGSTGWPVYGLVGAIGVAAAVRVAGDGLVSMKQQELAARVGLVAEQRLLGVVASVPLAKFFDSTWYDEVARARDGVTWRPALATGTVLTLVGTLASVAGLVTIIGVLDVRLLALALLAAVPVLLHRRRETRSIYLARRANTVLERKRDYLFETLLQSGLAKEVRSYDLARFFGEQHLAHGIRALDRERAVHRGNIARAAVAGIVSAVFLGAAYLLAGSQVAGQAVSAGQLFLVFAAFTTLTSTIGELFVVAAELEEHSAYLSDYFRLVGGPAAPAPRPAVPETREARAREEKPPRVEFRGVHYAYRQGTPAIRDLSFTIEPGELVALMGDNGAGKSTVVGLLLGLLTPDRGRVLVDDVDVEELGVDRVRELTGALFQEYGHYEFTVAEAIRLGRVDEPLDRPALLRAVDMASLRPLVDSLPQGVDSLVGQQFPGGRELSVGQWQRLALARMLYRDAPLWALDEPTAALDSATEVEFLRHLRRRRSQRTVLVVTHRLATAEVSDRILVLREGRLHEDGTHEDLIRAGGEYARYQSAYRKLASESD